MRCFYLYSIALVTLIFSVNIAIADVSFTGSRGLVIDMYPETPGPNEDVSITVKSYSLDIDRSLVVWKKDGREELRGYGERNFNTTTNRNDTTISVEVYRGDGTKVVKHINIAPRAITVLWESDDVYTPPFYRGKTFPTIGANIRLATAISGINEQNKNNFIFTWYENFTNQLVDDSGRGRSSVLYQNKLLNTKETIGVTINSPTGTLIGKKEIEFDVYDYGDILFYSQNDNGRTMYNRELNAYPPTIYGDQSMVIEAHPLYISTSEKDNFADIYIGWTADGQELLPYDPSYNYNKINVAGSGGDTGVAVIDVVIEGIEKAYQEAAKNFSVFLE